MHRFLKITIWVLAAVITWSSASLAAKTVTYYYTDPLGTVLATTDANGNVASQSDRRPYGEQVMGMQQSGPGYTGHVDDEETGLVYMQARYYDPSSGRFLGIDPMGFDPGDLEVFSKYSYAVNSPISNADPRGLYTCEKKGGCKAFEDAYAKLKEAAKAYSPRSSQGKAFAKVIAYYGEVDARNAQGQQVYINEGESSPGSAGDIAHNFVTGTDTVTFDFAKVSRTAQPLVEMAGMVAHEGQHGVDDSERRKRGERESDESVLQTERNAYRLQSGVSEAFRVNSAYLLWRNDWPQGEIESRRNSAVEAMAQESWYGWKYP